MRPLLELEARPYEPFSDEDLAGSLWDRFHRVASRFLHRPAIVHGGSTLTYEGLLHMANGLATRLNSFRPVSSSTPIAVLTSSPPQRIAAMWAALRQGRPFLPIDPSAPDGRVQFVLRDSRASIAVTDDTSRSALSLFDGDLIVPGGADAEGGEPGYCQVGPTHSALFLYTSGSTGQPKRVTQQHGMILDSLAAYSDAMRITPGDRLSLLASPGFGEAWNDVFLALLNGAAVCVREAKSHQAAELAHWLVDSEVTVLHCVPTLLRAMVARLPVGALAPCLRIVNLGGEAVSRTDVRLCFERLNPECVVVNSYGSTETKLIAQHFVDRESPNSGETLPVGRPRRGVDVRILDAAGTPMPDGEVGEIEVCSRSVVHGYSNRADEMDRFHGSTNERTRYRTGDLGRFNAEGLLEYLGRSDQMVKLRGYRIELAEIESVLQSHPLIRQAVLVVHEASPQVRQLIAVYQSDFDGNVSEKLLQDNLREMLPDYMVPSRLLRVEMIPLIDNGKPNRRVLLDLVNSRLTEMTSSHPEDLSDVERRLARLVADVLQIDDVTVDAGFIELGGDSLNVTQLLVRVNDEFGYALSADSVFGANSLREIAASIESDRSSRTSKA